MIPGIVTQETIANCFSKVFKGISSGEMTDNIYVKEFEGNFVKNNVNISASDYIDLDKYENTGNNFTDEDIIDMVKTRAAESV